MKSSDLAAVFSVSQRSIRRLRARTGCPCREHYDTDTAFLQAFATFAACRINAGSEYKAWLQQQKRAAAMPVENQIGRAVHVFVVASREFTTDRTALQKRARHLAAAILELAAGQDKDKLLHLAALLRAEND